jgi:hypothetical protein
MISGERAERAYRRLIGPHDDARHGHLAELHNAWADTGSKSGTGPAGVGFTSVLAYYDAVLAAPTATSWADNSGRGNNMSGSNVTVNATGGPGNGPWAGSSGTAQLKASFASPQPVEVFFIGKSSWVSTGSGQVFYDGISLNNGRFGYNLLGSNGLDLYIGAFLDLASPPSPASTWRNYDVLHLAAGASITVSGSNTTGAQGNTAMGGITLFTDGSGGSPLVGGFQVVVVCGANQSSGVRSNWLTFATGRGGT